MVAIVLIASVMVYAWATGLFGGMLVSTSSAKEDLSVDVYSVSGTTITTTLRNIGTSSVKLANYYVALGSQQICTGTLSATISVQTTASVSLTGCTLYSGIVYNAIIVTSRGNQFTFQVHS